MFTLSVVLNCSVDGSVIGSKILLPYLLRLSSLFFRDFLMGFSSIIHILDEL